MKKYKKVGGFVMNRKTGHTSYAYSQKNDIVSSLGFTHNKDDREQKKLLKHNINPNDKLDCYVKTNVEVQRYNTYRNKEEYRNYKIHNDDKPLITSIIQKNNKKRR